MRLIFEYPIIHTSAIILRSLLIFLVYQVGNLAAPVEEWTVGGTALTALMDVERRHGTTTCSSLHQFSTQYTSPGCIISFSSYSKC